MRQGFANLDEAARRGFNVWHRRVTLGMKYHKVEVRLFKLRQTALPLLEVKTDVR